MTHVMVMTAASALSEAALDALSAIGPVRVLADTAAETPCAPDAVLDFPGVDINIVPTDNRRKRLLIADMDSTIITVECLDELADVAGFRDQVKAITERAMAGELDFEGALRTRVALLKGLPADTLIRTFDERVRLTGGAATLVRAMNASGAMTALVSGGFTYFTGRVSAMTGFRENRANTLIERDGRLTGEVADPILGREAKLTALHQLCAAHGVTPVDAIAVGDGANDLAMIRAAGLGVAFDGKPVLEQGADARLRHSDLTALLHLQGYDGAEIADLIR